MLLGREVDLGSGNTVLDGDRVPPKRGIAPSPNFWSMFIVAIWLRISATAELVSYLTCI